MLASIATRSAAPPASPYADHLAQLRRQANQPLPPPADGTWHPNTPAYTRGEYTMVADENLRIVVELGPLLINHRFRGSSPPLQVSVWA